MEKSIVVSEGAPKALGPYSQAVWAGDFLFASGQIPLDPATGAIVAGGIVEQTHQALKNVRAVLQAAGLDLGHVVKTTVFLTDMHAFAAVNDVYAGYFQPPYPARSCVEVAQLPKDVLVELEVVAAR